MKVKKSLTVIKLDIIYLYMRITMLPFSFLN